MGLSDILKTLFGSKKSSLMLGRWGLEKCHRKLDRKIELSNEDHCGPCGEYILAKAVEKEREESLKATK